METITPVKKAKAPATCKQYKIVKADQGNPIPCKKIISSKEGEEFIRQFYGDDIEIYESVFVLLLNRASNTIGWAKISQGGITGAIVDVRLVCKYAVDTLATGIILAHNHPSGTLAPSQPDIDITKKIREALKNFDVQLYDHVILTSDGYYSMADEGII